MRLPVPTNHNYYGTKFIINDDGLKEAFGVRKAKDIKRLRNDVFGTTYELNTESESLAQIKIFGFKNKRNKLEQDPQLILKLYSKEDNQLNRQYFVQTGLFAGAVYHKNCQFNITSAYGDVFLQRMLSYVNDIYVDTREIDAKKGSNTNEFEHILAYLFTLSLERASAMGLPQIYQQKTQRSMKVRGKIDVNAYLRRDIPFQGKLTTTYREREYIQEILDILYLACRKLEKSFGKMIQSKIHGTYQLLKEHYSGSYPTHNAIQKAKNHTALLNPMYTGFRKTLEYAEIILKDLSLENTTDKKDNHTHGYLFDISELFELYLEKLLSRNFEDWIVNGQEELTVYNSTFFKRHMYPDIVMRHKYSNKVIVFDAKYKKMRMIKKDLDRTDFYQIHGYMQYYQSDLILGGLIYPLSKTIDPKKAYANSIFDLGNSPQKFIVEGIRIDKTMNIQTITENENKFIARIRELISRSEKD
jgi:5-methylcytosine-specific restriction enzyme subunit McrC